ncbi:hypothetical protein CU102_26770 [Phyllobacterium brassicacearum]|uniref:Uncharacterized protein n=1 Tax=Phyllobacterium brassicacearum TaxID=314235 RepID=A0A2P7B5D5_9HYPH|nr:hypothetical protein [Phyllobacterium brassicacearum]PSH61675.1 hypothetical protein CU102_26770 [Phyllobacterium brassicacearum]TDQ12793.1 hypothetical protein DEV91_1494 [Phyllobacterium brassicacearum]
MADANSGHSAGQLIPSNLTDLANQVEALRNLIDDIEHLGSLSILGSIENLTDKTLTFVNDEIEEGGYGHKQPDLHIPPRSPIVFTANNTNPFWGDTVGRVDYRTDDGSSVAVGLTRG